MRTQPQTNWILAGAVLGGFIVGEYPSEPRWLWGLGGGLAGGLLGALAAYLSARPWHWALRGLAVLLLCGGGFFLLFLAAGHQWLFSHMEIRAQ